MALLQINHKSNAVKTNLVLNISIPDITEDPPYTRTQSALAFAWTQRRWKHLGHMATLTGCRELGVIIIMPSGDRFLR